MRVLLALSAALTLVAPSLVSAQEALAAPPEVGSPRTGAKVWVGRHAEFEEFLRTATIERVEKVGEGVTDPDRAFFAAGGLAESALVKPLAPKRQKGFWESYLSEIAAYELDRILGLDMVPVTVERRVDGQRASVQVWLNGVRRLSEVKSATPARPLEWARQVCRQRIFDALAANIDRNAGNILVDGAWHLILIDHSRAFATNDTPFLDEITQTDRDFFEALKALDEATLTERLEPWLFGKGSVRDLLERRNKIVERLEHYVQERGELAVFPF
jgi:hypothetical protein